MIAAVAVAVALTVGVPAQAVPPTPAPAADCGEGTLAPCWNVPALDWWAYDLLASCESGGNWQAVSRSGRYRGGLQMSATFWAYYGGLDFAPTPDQATREEQIEVARHGHADRGWRPWSCARRVGLRP